MMANLLIAEHVTQPREILAKMHAAIGELSGPHAARAHDASTWAKIVAAGTPWLTRVALTCGALSGQVEDVVQDVWVAVVRHVEVLAAMREPAELGRWLYCAVQSKTRDVQRRAAHQPAHSLEAALAVGQEPVDQRQGPALQVEKCEEWERLHAAIEELRQQVNDTNSCVLRCCIVDGQSAKEVAAGLGKSAKDVRVRRCRLGRNLRLMLKNKFGNSLRQMARVGT